MSSFKLKPYNKNITNEELIADLQAVAKKLGVKTVKYDEYPEHGRCASRVFETRFGSWNNALVAAGLEVGRKYATDEDLLNNMQVVWERLGRQPRRQELKKPLSEFSGGTYERRYGGWRNALEAFIAYANEGVLQIEKSTGQRAVEARFPDLRMRWRVMNRDCFRCQACGRSPATDQSVKLHVDHIVPWSKGGKTADDNLQTLCEKCNLGKGDLSVAEV